MLAAALRLAGRLPMFMRPSSLTGVPCWKKSIKRASFLTTSRYASHDTCSKGHNHFHQGCQGYIQKQHHICNRKNVVASASLHAVKGSFCIQGFKHNQTQCYQVYRVRSLRTDPNEVISSQHSLRQKVCEEQQTVASSHRQQCYRNSQQGANASTPGRVQPSGTTTPRQRDGRVHPAEAVTSDMRSMAWRHSGLGGVVGLREASRTALVYRSRVRKHSSFSPNCCSMTSPCTTNSSLHKL